MEGKTLNNAKVNKIFTHYAKLNQGRMYPLEKDTQHGIVYLYSAQYLHVLQHSKLYLTDPTLQVEPNSQVTDIHLTERQRLKDDHL